MSVIICPNCGGRNEIDNDNPTECSFCGSGLSIDLLNQIKPKNQSSLKRDKPSVFYYVPISSTHYYKNRSLNIFLNHTLPYDHALKSLSVDKKELLSKVEASISVEASFLYLPYHLYTGRYEGYWTNQGHTESTINESFSFAAAAFDFGNVSREIFNLLNINKNELRHYNLKKIILNLDTDRLITGPDPDISFKKYNAVISQEELSNSGLMEKIQEYTLKLKAYYIENAGKQGSRNPLLSALTKYYVHGDFIYDKPALVYIPCIIISIRNNNNILHTFCYQNIIYYTSDRLHCDDAFSINFKELDGHYIFSNRINGASYYYSVKCLRLILGDDEFERSFSSAKQRHKELVIAETKETQLNKTHAKIVDIYGWICFIAIFLILIFLTDLHWFAILFWGVILSLVTLLVFDWIVKKIMKSFF